MEVLLHQIWEVVKPLLLAGLAPIISYLILTAIGLLVAWLFMRAINLSKRNDKFKFVWLLVLGYINKNMTGPDKKTQVIKKAHAFFRKGFFTKYFGRVSDTDLDTWIEGFYNSIMKGVAPLPNAALPTSSSAVGTCLGAIK